MKVAVVGSRGIQVEHLGQYLPPATTEIVSGGAKGADQCGKQYALEHRLKYTEFLPDYRRYGKGAPLKRNIEIMEYADCVVALWDGVSRGTKFVIEYCRSHQIPVDVYVILPEEK